MKVFINYRREDTEAYARLLRDRLAHVYGAENVFIDVVDLRPGLSWLEQIKESGASSLVFLSLIGPRWVSSMDTRSQSRFEQPVEDVVRQEIEFALSRGSGAHVIPVLVGGAQMPNGERLVRSIRPLVMLQAVELRHTHFDQDFGDLLGKLDAIRRQRADGGGPSQGGPEPPRRTPTSLQLDGDAEGGSAPSPNARHVETVIKYMLDEESVVPILGPDVNADRLVRETPSALPTAGELAAALARWFDLDPDRPDLARVAQHVSLTAGPPDLYKRLRRLLPLEPVPGVVHRFLAGLQQRLEQLNVEKRYQMIVTTNYDMALERAFEEAREGYDAVVYMASGPDRGKFVHFPFDSDPEVITVPNRYGKLPIDEYGEVKRSLIVKIHGAIDGSSGGYRWKDNYVVTEDQYIDYLSHSPVESLVPIQILDKLTAAHCLFLGYSMHDWNLRVFLKRIWDGGAIPAKSWAIERDPGAIECDFWRNYGVDLLDSALADYVGELGERLVSAVQR